MTDKQIVVQFMAGDALQQIILAGDNGHLSYKFEKLEDGQIIFRAWAGNETVIIPLSILVSLRMVL